MGIRDDNPAADIFTALSRRRANTQHHASVHYTDVAYVIDKLRAMTLEKAKLWHKPAKNTMRHLIEFLILTAACESEVQLADWCEIDVDSATWIIPAERRKSRIEHRIPLSTGALAILERVRPRSRGRGLVFPSTRKHRRPVSAPTPVEMLERAGIDATIHGFRSSFRTWAQEQTDTPWAMVEAALAHKPGGSEVMAYVRGSQFERRSRLMQEWCDYLGVFGEGHTNPFLIDNQMRNCSELM